MAGDHGGLPNGVLEEKINSGTESNGISKTHVNGKQLSAAEKRKLRKKRQKEAKLAER
jgi:hypothetical protein